MLTVPQWSRLSPVVGTPDQLRPDSLSPLRLLVVTEEYPYPPNHGGSADIWRRLKALQRLGCRLFLVCFRDGRHGPVPADHRLALESVVSKLVVFEKPTGVRSNLRRLWQVATRLPLRATACILSEGQQTALRQMVDAFQPNAVLLDHLYAAALARTLAARQRTPLIYRAHNVEHLYMQAMARSSTSVLRRLAFRLATYRLRGFERDVIAAADDIFWISVDDQAYWRRQGYAKGRWLPPLIDPGPPSQSNPDFAQDICFLGNLNAPNNVASVRWLLGDVMPLVWRRLPTASVTIAGSAPTSEIRQLAGRDSRVRLLADVERPQEIHLASRVLVNPALSGSGVNVKTLDMLLSGRPVVTTKQGAAGMSKDIQAYLTIADGAEAFARAVIDAMSSAEPNERQRQAIMETCSPLRLDLLFGDLLDSLRDLDRETVS